MSLIGSGTFARVYTGKTEHVVRKVTNREDNGEHPSGPLREISCLKLLKDHPYIIQLESVTVTPLSIELEFPRAIGTLSYLSSTTEISSEERQIYIWQLFQAVKSCHQRGIVHRDIHPENILYFKDSNRYSIKLADFGSARILPSSMAPWSLLENTELTSTVCCLWYRAPELLNFDINQTYSEKVDIWSLACVIIMLVNRIPYYRGVDEIDQLSLYLDFNHIRNLHQIFSQRSEMVLWDLVTRMLRYDPKKRESIDELLAHPYFTKFPKDINYLKEPIKEMIYNHPSVDRDLIIDQIYRSTVKMIVPPLCLPTIIYLYDKYTSVKKINNKKLIILASVRIADVLFSQAADELVAYRKLLEPNDQISIADIISTIDTLLEMVDYNLYWIVDQQNLMESGEVIGWKKNSIILFSSLYALISASPVLIGTREIIIIIYQIINKIINQIDLGEIRDLRISRRCRKIWKDLETFFPSSLKELNKII